jgi:hypothetical protein
MLFDDNVNPVGFSSVDDTMQKLNRTVVRYQGQPCFVNNIIDKDTVSVIFKRGVKATVVATEDLDISAPNLGLFYEPTSKLAILATRWCNRQYAGGLPPASIELLTCGQNGYAVNNAGFADVVYTIILTPDFTDMLNNKYRSVTTALDMLRAGSFSVPVRRYHWVRQNKSVVDFLFKDTVLISYCYAKKELYQGDKVEYIQSRLNSYVQAQIKEFMDYVKSV